MGDLYVQVSVNYPDEDATIEAGWAAELLNIRAWCLAKRLLTDGVVTHSQVARLAWDMAEQGTPDEIAGRLVSVGYWELAYRVPRSGPDDDPIGWAIVGWLKRNPSKAEVQSRKAAASDDGRRGNHVRWHDKKPDPDCPWCTELQVNRVPDGEAIGSPDTHPKGVTSPETETETEKDSRSSAPRSPDRNQSYDTQFNAWWKGYPRKVHKPEARDKFRARRRGGVTVERLTSARDHYAKAKVGEEQRYVMHAATFLARSEGPWSEWEHGIPPGEEPSTNGQANTRPVPALIERCEQCGEITGADCHGHV